ncbi:MAG: hypothetical protein GXP08_17220 [Gammaproteobacteria bacterium]|nr:hypothetical protein [Gammaproteobacteria bacterium]
MRIRLIQLLALATITIFSSMAFAGGATCNSKKGHKDMSASKEFKGNHSWLFSENGKHSDKSMSHSEKVQKQATKQSTGLVEI